MDKEDQFIYLPVQNFIDMMSSGHVRLDKKEIRKIIHEELVKLNLIKEEE